MNNKINDDYEIHNFSLEFKKKTINDKYILKCRRTPINLKILIPLLVFCLSVIPLNVQIRFLNGSMGLGWLISAYVFILAPLVLLTIIVLELLRERIERMEISRRTYYYVLKENVTIFYIFLHALATSISLYLRAITLCDQINGTSVFDRPICGDTREMPWDSFTITAFFTMLYRSTFTHPIFPTLICQLIQFCAVLAILIETTRIEYPTSLIMALITIGLYFVITHFLIYLKLHSINSFIMEDRIRAYDLNYNYNYDTQQYYNNEPTQCLDSAIYYHDEKEFLYPIRKVLSDSRVNYDNEVNKFENRSRSSSITSVDLTF